MDLRVCVCVRAAVCTWSLLRRESCIDVNSFSHSHARPEHMALRQHTLCLHVPSSSPLSPVSSITSPLFPRIHQFPPQFPPVASQTIANAINPRRLRYAVTFTFCVRLWFWFYCSCVVSHHFYFAFLFWIRVRRRCVKTQPQVVSERGENNFGSSFFFFLLRNAHRKGASSACSAAQTKPSLGLRFCHLFAHSWGRRSPRTESVWTNAAGFSSFFKQLFPAFLSGQ